MAATAPLGPPPSRADLLEREAEWLATPSRGIALDLISVAATAGFPSLVAKEAAETLLAEGQLTAMARRTAELVEHPPVPGEELDLPPAEEPGAKHAEGEVRRLRAMLNDDPRNAFAWAEQARMYVQIGQTDPAREAMRRALLLARDHRYLIRAAVRLSVHLGEPDRAEALLLSTPRTRVDPWLAASEISVSGLLGRGSRLARQTRLLLTRGAWSAGHLTELASALATAELDAGRSGRSRDLFLRSLELPNDNAVAQAESIGTRVPRVAERLAEVLDEVPKSYEARSLAAATAGRHHQAIEEALLWLADQPFSAEPAIFGSYQAAKVKDFERALDFAYRGLVANPTDLILRNNAAFALAKLNRPGEAQMRLHDVDGSALTEDERAMIRATEGLIALRRGEPELGQSLYLEAIELAVSRDTKFMAALMLVAETLRLHLPGAVEEAARLRAEAPATLEPKDHGWLDYLSEGE
jgi:tetratricopeptide (TPR) repeat protein